MTLTEAINACRETKAAIKAEQSRNEAEMRKLHATLARCNEVIVAFEVGLDSEKIQLAETVIYAGSDYGPHGEQREMLAKAIDDIAAGCIRLRSEYLGTKHYDRWWHQGTSHGYGYGPRHGSVAWSVGLTDEARTRIRNGGELTPEETEAAVYYLLNLKAIAANKAASRELATA